MKIPELSRIEILRRFDASTLFESVCLGMCLVVLVYLLPGCASTVTPDPIADSMASYDASTPAGYAALNSGIIDFTMDERGETTGAIITSNKRDRYNYLISCYAVQFADPQSGRGVTLVRDSGVRLYSSQKEKATEGTEITETAAKQSLGDLGGSILYWLDAEHLDYATTLEDWQKARRPKDSVWEKLRSKL